MSENTIKTEFASRLNELCDDMGIPEQGRQTHLAARFGVVPNAARKWLHGDGLPALEMCVRIANEANANISWLLQGEGLKRGNKIDVSAQLLKQALDDMPEDARQASFDFIGYQLTRADGFISGDKVTGYMKMLDKLKASHPKGKK